MAQSQRPPSGQARINWRRLLWPLLLIMILPTLSALLADWWLGTLPLVTIVAILICFPLATFLVIKIALQEMDALIAEITPPPPDAEVPESGVIATNLPETEVIDAERVPEEKLPRQ
jgi:hypothetical protein